MRVRTHTALREGTVAASALELLSILAHYVCYDIRLRTHTYTHAAAGRTTGNHGMLVAASSRAD